jgi:hypothetical protein
MKLVMIITHSGIAFFCFRTASALGEHRSWHHLDIVGTAGQQLGRVRVGLRVAKPMDTLMLQYKTACSQQQKQKVQESAVTVEPAQASAGASNSNTDVDTALQGLQQAAAQVRRGIVASVLHI